MNSEENRLRSFVSWPANAPIDPHRLARGGFYATGNQLETECHWCKKKISDWQYGDQIVARHRRLFPLCMYIINPAESGNIPLINGSVASGNESGNLNNPPPSNNSEEIDLKNEMHRLATFKNWPNPNISPQSLVKAGFYYLNQSDQVKCAWCKGVIAKWEKNDNAFEEHQRFFPDCPRVLLGPLIEIASDGIRDLGIQQISPPKKAKYSSLDARMRTYANWPIPDIQKPEALSQAGFYYQDIDDQVRCFHCNGGLRSWQKEDDPWFDHAKWFPHCQFVKLVMSPQYVTQVQEVARQMSQNNVCETSQEPILPDRPMTLDEAMCTAPVLQALEMGLNAGCVRNATQRQLEIAGRPYETNEELVKAVLGDQLDEDDEVEDYENPMTQQLSRLINSFFGEVRSETRPDATNQMGQTVEREQTNHIPPSTSSSSSNNQLPSECIPSSSHQAPVAIPETLRTAAASIPGPSKWTSESPSKTADSNNEKNLSLEEENRKLKDARLCKVCMDEEVGVVFLPCGHLVTCVQCAPTVSQCPLCRTTIKGFVRTFLS
ncbi:death-associated inhibitor of apoptosis 2 [Episyrphus balteatus]|uniref:death-associated inhibitor of apoptosis 2 n=1 Tax=Episyrphus balteatus TaxID=286459 RepID=UPI002486157C|nr:death-associated inhibitor of apoptosis 2 [Episyrphus balteatus]